MSLRSISNGQKAILAVILAALLYGGYRVMLPLSLRNNNPLNIRDDGTTAWQGLDEPRAEKGYLRFTDPKYGYRAATRVLRSYRSRGIYSIEQIIKTWAPPSENPTDAYIALVRQKAGFQPGHIVVEEEGDLLPLFKAMAVMEAGAAYSHHAALDDETIKAGIALA